MFKFLKSRSEEREVHGRLLLPFSREAAEISESLKKSFV